MKTRESMTEATETNPKQMTELLCQALETEMGGVEVYRAAIQCAENEDLREEWSKHLEQTERHVEIVRGIFEALGLDTEEDSPGRQIVREKAAGLVSAMQKALKEAPEAAEIVVNTSSDGTAEAAAGRILKVLRDRQIVVEDSPLSGL